MRTREQRYFSPVVDRYFLQWIVLPTWDSMHPMDMQRFYQFLKALKRYSRKDWSAYFIQNIVNAAKHFHPNRDADCIRKAAVRFLEIAEDIFAYESAPFPDPLVEMRNPYQVALYLRSLRVYDEHGREQDMYSQEEIEKILEENFGPDWREQKSSHRQKS